MMIGSRFQLVTGETGQSVWVKLRNDFGSVKFMSALTGLNILLNFMLAMIFKTMLCCPI